MILTNRPGRGVNTSGASRPGPIDPATRLAEILGEFGLGQLAGLETLCDRATRKLRADFRIEPYPSEGEPVGEVPAL